MHSFLSDRGTLNCKPRMTVIPFHRVWQVFTHRHLPWSLWHPINTTGVVMYKVLQNPISTEMAPQLASCLQKLALTGPQAFNTGSHQDDRPPDVVSLLSNCITPLMLHFQSALIGPNCKHCRCEWCYFLINELLYRVSRHNTQMSTEKAASSHKSLLAPRMWFVAPAASLFQATLLCQWWTVIQEHSLVLLYGLL